MVTRDKGNKIFKILKIDSARDRLKFTQFAQVFIEQLNWGGAQAKVRKEGKSIL